MTMSPHHTFSRAVIRFPSSLGTKGAEVLAMFRLQLQPPRPPLPHISTCICISLHFLPCQGQDKAYQHSSCPIYKTYRLGLEKCNFLDKVKKHCQSAKLCADDDAPHSENPGTSSAPLDEFLINIKEPLPTFSFSFVQNGCRYYASLCFRLWGWLARTAVMRDTLNLLTSTQTTKEKITGCASDDGGRGRDGGQIKKKTGLWGLSQMTGRGLRGSNQFNFFFQFTKCSPAHVRTLHFAGCKTL